jgi:hypothetical protein
MLKLQVCLSIGMVAALAAMTVAAAFAVPSASAARPGCSGNPHGDDGSGNPHDDFQSGPNGNPHPGGFRSSCPGQGTDQN